MRSITLSFFLIFCCLWITPVYGEIIFEDDFDSYTDSITQWSMIASNISLQKTGGVENSQCARVYYDSSGTSKYWFSKNILDHQLSEIYVRFYFKVDAPSGGCKFLKLFGERDAPTGYANTTFMLKYTRPSLFEISYGDGSSTSNDTQSIIRYAGAHTDDNVNIVEATDEFFPVAGQWHCFEAHMKYNSDGQRDGIYQVWIDGTLRIHATNVKNRNDLNSKFFDSVDLANYCSDYFESSWNLWYDNVVISTTRVCCSSADDLAPPLNLNAD